MAGIEFIFFDQIWHRQILENVMLENRNIYSPTDIFEPWIYWVTALAQGRFVRTRWTDEGSDFPF
jgi:hypothetical protein